MPQYETRDITVDEALGLRGALLDPGNLDAARPGPADINPEAAHVGAFLGNTLVGVGSIHPQAMPDGHQTTAWRLRGVAVEHGHRGRGVGARIVTECLEHAGSEGGKVVWCLAPPGALEFFERCGFRSGAAEGQTEAGEPILVHVGVGPLERDWSLTQPNDPQAGQSA